jgi:hypothetical protein
MAEPEPIEPSLHESSPEQATLQKPPDHETDQSPRQKLYIRIPREIWNSVQPQPAQPPSSGQSSSGERVRCRVKLYRFIPGGPDRETVGKRMNNMYLQRPCLQSTCSYCRENHPQRIHDPPALQPDGNGKTQDGRGEGYNPDIPEVEPLNNTSYVEGRLTSTALPPRIILTSV